MNSLTCLLFFFKCLHSNDIFWWKIESRRDGAYLGCGLLADGIWEMENVEIFGRNWISSTLKKSVLKSIPYNFDSEVYLNACMWNASIAVTNAIQKLLGNWNSEEVLVCGVLFVVGFFFFSPHGFVGCNYLCWPIFCFPYSKEM